MGGAPLSGLPCARSTISPYSLLTPCPFHAFARMTSEEPAAPDSRSPPRPSAAANGHYSAAAPDTPMLSPTLPNSRFYYPAHFQAPCELPSPEVEMEDALEWGVPAAAAQGAETPRLSSRASAPANLSSAAANAAGRHPGGSHSPAFIGRTSSSPNLERVLHVNPGRLLSLQEPPPPPEWAQPKAMPSPPPDARDDASPPAPRTAGSVLPPLAPQQPQPSGTLPRAQSGRCLRTSWSKEGE
jgi:hypothetical protein